MNDTIKKETLGQALIDVGVINEEQLNSALEKCGSNERNLPEALIDMGFVTEGQIIKAVGIKSQIPYFDNLEGLVTEESPQLLPEELSRKYQVVPLFLQGGSLLLAMINPYDIYAVDDISRYVKTKVEPVISTRETILSTISSIYKKENKIESETNEDLDKIDMKENLGYELNEFEIVETSDKKENRSNEDIAQQAPIINFVDKVMIEAIKEKASDIHIEPKSNKLSVRYRLDGILHETVSVPKALAAAVTSRIKILSKLDISETRRPQDGRIKIKLKKDTIDMRVSTIPTVSGEKTVIRILDKNTMITDLSNLGLPSNLYVSFREVINHPHGVLLVTGPTGSGKTTTLYAALHSIMDKTKNISTLEDPVEYEIDGINQIQVNNKTGLTFANGLRSLLRQDPDVLLVGEIRDQETADIAIQAALTGHMVFATLHTNNASGAISRMIDMGVEPFLLNSALVGVMAQRLVRLLCKSCCQPYKPARFVFEKLGLTVEKAEEELEKYTFYRPVGCEKCMGTGYKGRIGIYELLPLNREVQEKILERSSQEEISEVARKFGFKAMLEQSHEKILAGQTSVEEVLRVIGRV
jgi:type IV pilus assembly protein PilB